MKIKALLTLIGLSYVGWLPSVWAQEVRILTKLQPDRETRAGQTLYYNIDVLTDTWLTGTPSFPGLDIPATLTSFEGSQGRPIQHRIEGKAYFGVRYRYRLTPLQAGVTAIPALTLQVHIGQADTPVQAQVPAHSFAVQALPAKAQGKLSLLASDVQLSQRLQPSSDSIEQGQPLIREIRVEAQNALALSIPAVTISAVSALQGTRLPADISTLTDAAGNPVGGVRIESVRYLPEQRGTHQIPAVELAWWDIDEQKMKLARLPELTIEVIPTSRSTSSQTTLKQFSDRLVKAMNFSGSGMVLLALFSLSVWACVHYRRSLFHFAHSCVQRLHQHWHDSRTRAGLMARKQLRQRTPELTATYQLLRRDTQSPSVRHAKLEAESQETLLTGLDLLYQQDPVKPKALRLLGTFLRQLSKRKRPKHSGSHSSPLPPLNRHPISRDRF